ncbi:TlpA family protein disulfide reductase [Flavobacterium azooxidireducens]|jgi:thiol-disulfide isomerase/thioredoxin|uniref:TlpA family protein disulfide reductase n=1 Tax=Flavobacterium azooxidireducens TaxID=1871076 RepID=A0ABY4KL12_9FLAO|nr:TlpA disulfide reductase family protein [Flavobacterium azooxidireducens]UPQ80363.1 TlpA family protein disulfide reductase [Flavobacterium azooxidireducens]
MKKIIFFILGISMVLVLVLFLFKDKFSFEIHDKTNLNESVIYKNYIQDDKLIVVNYWASWCAPCIEEIPFLNNVKKSFDNEVVFLSFSKDKDTLLTKKAISEHNFNWSEITLIDYRSKHALNSFFNDNSIIEIDVLPKTYFIKNGEVVKKLNGKLDSIQVYDFINKNK